jgi:spectinomycin phosphotransferase
VSRHAPGLVAALAEFDDLAAQVAAVDAELVLTHGEPHPGNLIRRGADYLLIDWDTAGLAPPERDLWWILSDSGTEAARYAELTGREVSEPAVALYRMRWDLDDVGLLLADFRAPHRQDEDTEQGWAALGAAVQRLASPEKIS